ncbi:hypothetical protein B6V73_17205 [Thioclava sp. JM3]|uniref:DUF6538 domain-containing protein n=1 Tax=Thioclava sp. JM3 TaxID=1973004 RepID=UPI000B53D482|nr:DUF6538 domain-containing protein [Thioclava sp. JM3]OWY13526.1 hypothetical protein B6V73_17205 [Thioclava sp. JM3]
MTQTKVSGTILRGGIYHLKIRVPAPLQPLYGGKEFLEGSTRSRNRKDAELRVSEARLEMDRLGKLDRETFDKIARAGGIRAFEAAHSRDLIGAAFRKSSLSESEMIEMGYSEEEAIVEAVKGGRIDTKLDAELADSERTLRKAGAQVATQYARSLEDVAADFVAYNNYQSGDAMRAQMLFTAKLFVEAMGEIPADKLTTAHLHDFMHRAKKLPIANRKEVKGLPFDDAITIADAKGLPRISDKTLGYHLWRLKRLSAFAVERGNMTSDPWASVKPPRTARKSHAAKKEEKRQPFNGEQIALIIDAARQKYDRRTIDYWGPIFTAYYGFRIEEITQVFTSDIVTVDDLPCIRISDAERWQKVKNPNAIRTLPIHPAILEMGFLDMVEERRNTSDSPLLFMHHGRGDQLYEREPSTRGRLAEAYGQRFGRFLDLLGINDPRFVFHSFRHRWEDCARWAQLPEEHQKTIAGRARNGSGAGYGHGVPVPLLLPSVSAINPAMKP